MLLIKYVMIGNTLPNRLQRYRFILDWTIFWQLFLKIWRKGESLVSRFYLFLRSVGADKVKEKTILRIGLFETMKDKP